MKKLYEIEDFENKKVCCKAEEYTRYIKFNGSEWLDNHSNEVGYLVGCYFNKPIWYEYEEPKEKTKPLEVKYVVYKDSMFHNGGERAVCISHEEALKYITDIAEDGVFEIRKVYVRE